MMKSILLNTKKVVDILHSLVEEKNSPKSNNNNNDGDGFSRKREGIIIDRTLEPCTETKKHFCPCRFQCGKIFEIEGCHNDNLQRRNHMRICGYNPNKTHIIDSLGLFAGITGSESAQKIINKPVI